MTSKSYTRYTLSLLITLIVLPSTAFSWPNAQDPTVPSSQISERLKLQRKSNSNAKDDDEKEKLTPHQLRLKAIVLRDKDNGTALLSDGGSRKFVVKLRRPSRSNLTNHVNIFGFDLVIKEFDKSEIVFQDLKTNEQFVIN